VAARWREAIALTHAIDKSGDASLDYVREQYSQTRLEEGALPGAAEEGGGLKRAAEFDITAVPRGFGAANKAHAAKPRVDSDPDAGVCLATVR
jgi:hypothetical protein